MKSIIASEAGSGFELDAAVGAPATGCRSSSPTGNPGQLPGAVIAQNSTARASVHRQSPYQIGSHRARRAQTDIIGVISVIQLDAILRLNDDIRKSRVRNR